MERLAHPLIVGSAHEPRTRRLVLEETWHDQSTGSPKHGAANSGMPGGPSQTQVDATRVAFEGGERRLECRNMLEHKQQQDVSVPEWAWTVRKVDIPGVSDLSMTILEQALLLSDATLANQYLFLPFRWQGGMWSRSGKWTPRNQRVYQTASKVA